MIPGICESDDCTSFSVLEVLCLVPVVLESSFRLWNGVLVNLRDPGPSSRSFSTPSTPLAARQPGIQAQQTSILEYPHLDWLVRVVSALAEINGWVPTMSVE